MSQGASTGTQHALKVAAKSERVVIVGTGETAAVAYEYFSYDSGHEVVAFSAEAPFITTDVFCGLPVVPLDRLRDSYPPAEYRAFVAVSMTELNRVRRRLYDAVKALGFDCVSYVSSHAFAMGNVEIGENTFVQENASLQYGAIVGDNVFIGSGTCIGHSSVIEDDCFAGPDATVCGFSRVGRGCFLGAKSCIADGLSVGPDCIIGAGAVILKDTEPHQVYLGNPARPIGRDSLEVSRERDRTFRGLSGAPARRGGPAGGATGGAAVLAERKSSPSRGPIRPWLRILTVR